MNHVTLIFVLMWCLRAGSQFFHWQEVWGTKEVSFPITNGIMIIFIRMHLFIIYYCSHRTTFLFEKWLKWWIDDRWSKLLLIDDWQIVSAVICTHHVRKSDIISVFWLHLHVKRVHSGLVRSWEKTDDQLMISWFQLLLLCFTAQQRRLTRKHWRITLKWRPAFVGIFHVLIRWSAVPEPHVEPLCSCRRCWESSSAPSRPCWSKTSRSPRRTFITSESSWSLDLWAAEQQIKA